MEALKAELARARDAEKENAALKKALATAQAQFAQLTHRLILLEQAQSVPSAQASNPTATPSSPENPSPGPCLPGTSGEVQEDKAKAKELETEAGQPMQEVYLTSLRQDVEDAHAEVGCAFIG